MFFENLRHGMKTRPPDGAAIRKNHKTHLPEDGQTHNFRLSKNFRGINCEEKKRQILARSWRLSTTNAGATGTLQIGQSGMYRKLFKPTSFF
jgi:hypothetical protein